jgi:hypothetical protein
MSEQLCFGELSRSQFSPHRVANSQIVFSYAGMGMSSCQTEPFVGQDVASGRSVAFVIHKSQQILRSCMPLFGRAGVPVDCRSIVRGHAAAVLVHETKLRL